MVVNEFKFMSKEDYEELSNWEKAFILVLRFLKRYWKYEICLVLGFLLGVLI